MRGAVPAPAAPAQAEALRLRDLRGLRFEAVARATSLSRPGAKARVRRARLRLAADLARRCAALRARPVAEALERARDGDCCGPRAIGRAPGPRPSPGG